MRGATLANYTEVTDLLKDDKGNVIGVKAKDNISNKEFTVKAKVVVNCAGVHSDVIRKMDNPEVAERMVPSRGIHIIFKKGFLKENYGMIVPETSDGRLLYLINYYGHPMLGTTDEFQDATHFCEPSQAEIDFLIKEIKPYFNEDYDFKNNI